MNPAQERGPRTGSTRQSKEKANLEEELRARQRHDLAVEATKAKVGAVAVEAAVVGDGVDTNAVIEAVHAVGSVGWRGGVAAIGENGGDEL